MNPPANTTWLETNQRALTAALGALRARLEHYSGQTQAEADVQPEDAAFPALPADAPVGQPSALESLCLLFGLSPFERDLLLLCAGVELDAPFAALCAEAQGDATCRCPTFSLALAALPEAHWNAMTPASPLRYWRMIEVGTGALLTHSPLRIDERILHYLTGLQYLDERLAALVKPAQASGHLAPSHQQLAEELAQVWSPDRQTRQLPLVHLCGDETTSKRDIAAAGCALLGLNLCLLSAHSLPIHPQELEAFIRLWEREALLGGRALLLDCHDLESADAGRLNAIVALLEQMPGALIVTSRERRQWNQRPCVSLEVQKPTASEQLHLWEAALGPLASDLNGQVERLVAQFHLSASAIASASLEALSQFTPGNSPTIDGLSDQLWRHIQLQARPRLDMLARRIEPAAAWADLVLPEAQSQALREVAIHVRQRTTVYQTWGFASRGSRGLGMSALFAGPSGTGKTMAAEVLANELRLDLYHIDLSSVISKYIGETEKNLRRVFDAAEESGVILLFDEADALFGKRSEVKDSHDRYANIEVSYLLQRMEAYRGLAILTSNMKSALDTAFLRRFRFIIQFPFPDAAQRALIWQRIFPAATPTAGLDVARLARLNVAGGNIRSIALSAAFLAAEAGEPVQMKHLLSAARSEYTKLERPLTEAEIGGWV